MESRQYLEAEGFVGRSGDVSAVIDALDDLFLVGTFSDEGYIVNDEHDGTTHGTTTQEYLYWKNPELITNPSTYFPDTMKIDITYTKYPSPTNPLFQHDVTVCNTSGLGQANTNHFRLTRYKTDGFAWVFVPDTETRGKNLRTGTWKEMNIVELGILYDVLAEIQSLGSKIEKAPDNLITS